MKCIINCCETSENWAKSLVQHNLSAFLLKIANKPLLEYYIDFCSLVGVKEIRIVTDSPENNLDKFYETGEQWGISISNSLVKPGDSAAKIIEKNKGFLENSDFILLNKMFFINYDKNHENYKFPTLDKNLKITLHDNDTGIFFYKENKQGLEPEKYENSELSINSLDCINDYFQISQRVLAEDSDKYVLPGYSKEKGVFIGQNVGINKYTKIDKPVSIGNNVRLLDSEICSNTIIGSNSLIDKKTKVQNSIIYDDTYIGSNLEITDKIIVRKKIIDPETGESIDVPDDFIVSKLKREKSHGEFRRILFWPIALIITLIQLPLLILIKPFTSLSKIKLNYYISKDTDETVLLSSYEDKKDSLINRLFFCFSLDKFPLLLKVLSFKLYLAGNNPIPKDEAGQYLIEDMYKYKPAAFSINDMLNKNKADIFEKNINELFYSNNSKLSLDIQIIFKSIIKRFFR